MRKINISVVLNPVTFKPIFQAFVINEDGSKEKFTNEIEIDEGGWNPEPAIVIRHVTDVFTKYEQRELTNEEISFLTRKMIVEEPTEVELLKLSGIK